MEISGTPSEENVLKLSKLKKEPKWMREKRLEGIKQFLQKPMPNFGPDLSAIDFSKIVYYKKSESNVAKTWEDVPEKIRTVFDKLGIPEAEKKYMAGLGAQHESEAVYHHIQYELTSKGVIFLDMDSALKEYPEIVEKYFSKLVPASDNKFASLNTAFWSGGTFIYVPKGVKIEMPLHAYFRIDAKSMGQFERTLIVVDEGASLHYIEGCTAPLYGSASLHAAIVEVFALKNSSVRYTTLQNWSGDVYNLVTKRAMAEEGAYVEWLDGNLGSGVTMKYPCIILKGDNSKADLLSISLSSAKQHQDSGGKLIHIGKNTKSRIVQKSVCKEGGEATFRGLIKVGKSADNSVVTSCCDTLLMDTKSKAQTYPDIKVDRDDAVVKHEASTGRIEDQKVLFLRQRGFSLTEANSLIVLGFISDFAKALPMDYALELRRLIELEMEGTL